MGIERAYASVARAQIVLQVFDAADPAVESLDLRPDQCRILVANKIDRIDPAAAPVSLPDGALPLSAREGRGMEQLLERLRAAVDASALTQLSSEEIIDRFLQEEDLRIVAGEGEPEEEVVLQPELDDDDEVVTEELAEIYLAQGLRDKSVAIYRKLSLRNPEKSVYFAELIGKIENNIKI